MLRRVRDFYSSAYGREVLKHFTLHVMAYALVAILVLVAMAGALGELSAPGRVLLGQVARLQGLALGVLLVYCVADLISGWPDRPRASAPTHNPPDAGSD